MGKAPLPAEWTEHQDNGDRVFYFNAQSNESSWTHPLEQIHREIYKTIVDVRNGPHTREEKALKLEKLRRDYEKIEADTHAELQLWTEHLDRHGTKFFYNQKLQSSVWTDPRPAKCHVLHLKLQANRVLNKVMGQGSLDSSPKKARDRENHPEQDNSLDRHKRSEEQSGSHPHVGSSPKDQGPPGANSLVADECGN